MARRILVALAALLVALPAAAVAGSYVVTLHSGGVFESRYKPQEAPWDSGKILLRSEYGNWISLRRADVAKVESSTERRGLGVQINTTTIELGWAPNDNLTPEQAAEAAKNAPQQPQGPAQPVYTMQQFVEPGATSGMPVGWTGVTTPPVTPNAPSYGATVGIPVSTQPPVIQ